MMEKREKATEQRVESAHLKKEAADLRGSEDRSAEREYSVAIRLRRGERAAAQELVDMYYERIYSFMRGVGHGQQISEDLTQETFLKAWAHIGQLRNGRALGGWLYRIAGNVSRVYWRKQKNRKFASMERIEKAANGETEPEKVGHYEELVRLQEAIAQLPWKLRNAIVLHYMQHLTIVEAAEAAGVREGTFKSRLNRALQILRKQVS
jgi:RNA polymerase sigma-70 factor (ECF subfamily)